MPQDFDTRLAALAEHAHRTGRLDAPAAVRARADRRRRRRYAATGALGVVTAGALGVGIAVAQPPSRSTPSPPAPVTVAAPSTTATRSAPAPSVSPPPPSARASSAPTSASASSSPSARASSTPAVDPFSGKRQVVLVPVVDGKRLPGSTLSVGADGRVQPTGEDDRSLFVPVPVAPGEKRYLLKTGAIVTGGEPECMTVRSGGSGNPLVPATAACDAGNRDQIARFDKAGASTWHIALDGLYLTWFPDGEYGLIAQESGEGDSMRPFAVVDRGAANLPALD